MWGYNGMWPGPTFEVKKGQATNVRWINELPGSHFLPIDTTIHGADKSVPEVRTVTHLHGAKVMPEDDGYPDAWISSDGKTGPSYSSAWCTLSERSVGRHFVVPRSLSWHHAS